MSLKNNYVPMTVPCILLLFLAGCAATVPQKKLAGDLGIIPDTDNIFLKIHKIYPKSAAEEAGLKAGDVIMSVDGKPIIKPGDFLDQIRESAYKKMDLGIMRNDKVLSVKVRTRPYDKVLSAEDVILQRLIWSGVKIRCSVVVQDVTDLTQSAGEQRDQWINAVKSKVESDLTTSLLGTWNEYPGFSVVGRENTEKALDELKLHLSGPVVPDTIQQIGRLSGATHIWVLELFRNTGGKGPHGLSDLTTRKLIEVETGKVLSSMSWASER